MKKRFAKLHPALQGCMWFTVVMVFLGIMFSVTFLLTDWFFHTTGFTPPPLVLQVVNSIGGLLLTALLIGVVSYFARSHITDGETMFISPIIEVLQRIAKGDFSARVANTVEGRKHIFETLVDNVNRMASELNQMEKMRQEFISNVSHEIQSPLTSIRGFAQALQNPHLSAEDRAHYLNIIEIESTRLSRITENLLKLASLEAEHLKFEPKPYRLDRQIRNLVLACEPQWAEKAIEMDVGVDEVEITADEDLLSQVWINLIHNSIKYTEAGGRIGISLGYLAHGITFKIADTGIGIAKDDQAHIFERFYKADRSRTRSDNGGSGLGLAIAQKIVEIHAGIITVESEPGVGTQFTVTLPRKSAAS